MIAEYLLANYPVPQSSAPAMADRLAQPGTEWTDRRLFATIQTLGATTVLVSQTRWAGTIARDNAFVARNADRVLRLLD